MPLDSATGEMDGVCLNRFPVNQPGTDLSEGGSVLGSVKGEPNPVS